ncbi:MAG TPA: AMP-binding protein [Acidimicrobiia bacterium]|nr:AMP-binding protein [Acidimicrobiia bacterium]
MQITSDAVLLDTGYQPGAHAAVSPDRPAIVMAATGRTVTYAELDGESARLARAWRAAGLRPGDGVALLVENHPRFLVAAWAAQRSGLYFTPISTQLGAAEVGYILLDCGASVLVASARTAAVAAAAAARLDSTPRMRLLVDDPADGGVPDGFVGWDDAVAGHPAAPLDGETEGADMVYSSGTTGRPKGIKRPLAGEPFGTPPRRLAAMVGLYGFGADTVYLSPAPLYHAGPLRYAMTAQRLGATVVVMDRFNAAAALDALERHRVTHSFWVPTMFVRLLQLPAGVRVGRNLAAHRVALHSGAPCPVEVKRQMMDWWGPILHEFYGGSEGAAFVACGPDEWLARPGTVGRSLRGTVHVLGDDGSALPPGTIGEVWFEGGQPFEYHNDPAKTAGATRQDGWATLGDIGYVDGDGYLFLTDRKAFTIVSGGVNIYPQEAENVLAGHPAVADVAVFGVPNAEFGEEVKAVVVPLDPARAGAEFEAELIRFCRDQIAAYKCPRSIDFRTEVPRGDNGKLYKRALRDEYWTKEQACG